MAAPPVRRRVLADFTTSPRSVSRKILSLGHWAARALWQRRNGVGGIAVLAILLPLVIAAFLSSDFIRWMLVGVSLIGAFGVLGMLALLRVVEAADARAADYALQAQLNAEETALRQIRRMLSKPS